MDAHDYSEERWLPVVGYEGIYEVSSHGRVRSLNRVAGRSKKRKIAGQMIASERPNSWGYPVVQLHDAEGRHNVYVTHRVVAAAFLGPRPEGHDVNHIDGNKRNARAENLEYVTRSENNLHAYRTGLKLPTEGRRGEANSLSKLDDNRVRVARKIYASGHVTQTDLAAVMGIGHAQLSEILRGQAWKHVG